MKNKLTPETYKIYIEYIEKNFSSEIIEEKFNKLYQEISNLYQNNKSYLLREMLILCGQYCGRQSECAELQGQETRLGGLLRKDDEERLIADLNAVCCYVFAKFLGEVLTLEAMGKENSNIDEWARRCPSYHVMGDLYEMKDLCDFSNLWLPSKTSWIILRVDDMLEYLSKVECSEGLREFQKILEDY